MSQSLRMQHSSLFRTQTSTIGRSSYPPARLCIEGQGDVQRSCPARRDPSPAPVLLHLEGIRHPPSRPSLYCSLAYSCHRPCPRVRQRWYLPTIVDHGAAASSQVDLYRGRPARMAARSRSKPQSMVASYGGELAANTPATSARSSRRTGTAPCFPRMRLSIGGNREDEQITTHGGGARRSRWVARRLDSGRISSSSTT